MKKEDAKYWTQIILFYLTMVSVGFLIVRFIL